MLDGLKDGDLLFVISDHGFNSFRRGVNLNSWLHANGYLTLKDGKDGSAEWLRDVDWSRTKAYAFGLGGIYVEVLRDVVLRLCPLLDRDADEMIREVRMHKLLEGVRGEGPRDLAALAETLLRISQLAERHPRIQEMDINPLLAHERGAVAVDARIAVAKSEERTRNVEE